jgi:hypothetical protein
MALYKQTWAALLLPVVAQPELLARGSVLPPLMPPALHVRPIHLCKLAFQLQQQLRGDIWS